jgi:hypothetical protein
LRYSLVGSTLVSEVSIVTGSLSGPASTTRRAVMSFWVLATARRVFSAFPARMRPVRASITLALSAATAGGGPAGVRTGGGGGGDATAVLAEFKLGGAQERTANEKSRQPTLGPE